MRQPKEMMRRTGGHCGHHHWIGKSQEGIVANAVDAAGHGVGALCCVVAALNEK
jgi:hypothetical protein